MRAAFQGGGEAQLLDVALHHADEGGQAMAAELLSSLLCIEKQGMAIVVWPLSCILTFCVQHCADERMLSNSMTVDAAVA